MAMKRVHKSPPPRTAPTIERRKVTHIEQRTAHKGQTEETGVFTFESGSIIQYEDASTVGFE